MNKFAYIAGSLLMATTVSAGATETMYLAGWGGDIEKVFREKILPPFEKKHDVKISYVTGNSSDTLAKVMAQKGNQDISVAFMDEFAMVTAVGAGLCAKIDDGEQSQNVYSNARMGNNQAIGMGFYAVGLVYTPRYSKRMAGPHQPLGKILRTRNTPES